MKNMKKLFFVLLLVCAFMLPNVVSAATKAKLVLECGETTYNEKEEGVTCTVGLEIPDDETIAFKSLSFNLAKDAVGDEATIEAIDTDTIAVAGDLGGTITITKKENGTFSSSETLLVIKNVTMPGIDKAKYEKGQYKYTISLNNVKLVVNESTSYTGADSKTVIRLLSTDNKLASISIDGASLAGFNSNASLYKYTTSNNTLKLSAVANNQNAKIAIGEADGTAKEIKDKKLSLPYGDTEITIKVTSESGQVKVYMISVFRFYKLFPGYNFEFNSKNGLYKLNVGKDITKFAICENGVNDVFVKKDGVVCINTKVLEDVYGYTAEGQQATYYKTLKLNGTYVTADYASLSAKEKFDRWEPVTDQDGNQTVYYILADLKDGENTLTFSVDDIHPEYKVVITKGEKTDATVGDSNVKPEEKPADGVGSDSEGNKNESSNNATNNGSTSNDTVKDETVESPKTGIVTYTLIIAGLAAVAGGVYYLLKKKNIFKKI